MVCRQIENEGIALNQRESKRPSPEPNLNETAHPVSNRLGYIDGMRGLAVAGVVLMHANTWGYAKAPWLHFLVLGRAGVDLFLVLSGFCLFLPLVKQGDGTVRELNLREYVHRRARRICPPYYAALVIAIAVCFLTYKFGGASWWTEPFQTLFPLKGVSGVADILTHATLTHGLVNRYAHGISAPFWSLSLEVQFYALLPFLVLIARRYSVAWAILIPVIVSLLYRSWLFFFHRVVLSYYIGDEICVSRWVEIGMGMAAAVAVSSIAANAKSKFNSPAAIKIILLASVLVLAVVVGFESYDSHLFLLPFGWGAAFCLLIISVQHSPPLKKLLEWKPLVALGTMSYSVYLIHDCVFRLFSIPLSRFTVSANLREILYYFIGIPITLLLSRLFFIKFEKPFMKARS